MTYIVSGGALNSTHSLTHLVGSSRMTAEGRASMQLTPKRLKVPASPHSIIIIIIIIIHWLQVGINRKSEDIAISMVNIVIRTVLRSHYPNKNVFGDWIGCMRDKRGWPLRQKLCRHEYKEDFTSTRREWHLTWVALAASMVRIQMTRNPLKTKARMISIRELAFERSCSTVLWRCTHRVYTALQWHIKSIKLWAFYGVLYAIAITRGIGYTFVTLCKSVGRCVFQPGFIMTVLFVLVYCVQLSLYSAYNYSPLQYMKSRVGIMRFIVSSKTIWSWRTLASTWRSMTHIMQRVAQKGSHYQWSPINRIKTVNETMFFIRFEYEMSKRNIMVCIKYSMYYLICDLISCCVWRSDTVKINVYDKIVIEWQKKNIKYGNK